MFHNILIQKIIQLFLGRTKVTHQMLGQYLLWQDTNTK